MKNKVLYYLGILVMLVFGMLVVGCDTPDEGNIIIGEWYKPGDTLTFKSDNTVAIWTTSYGTKISTYRLDGKILEITDFYSNNYTGTVSFERVDQKSSMFISGFKAPVGSNLFTINGTYTKRE